MWSGHDDDDVAVAMSGMISLSGSNKKNLESIERVFGSIPNFPPESTLDVGLHLCLRRSSKGEGRSKLAENTGETSALGVELRVVVS